MAGKRSNSTSNIGCLSFQLIALKDIDSNLTRLKGSPKLGKAVEKRRHEMEPYLNQKTSATQLFGASKSPFNTNVVKSVNAIKNRRGLEDVLIKKFEMTIRDMTDNDLLRFAKENVD